MRISVLKKRIIVAVLVLFAVGNVHAQFEEGQKDPTQIAVITGNQTLPANNTVTIYASQGESSKKIQNIVRFKVNELASSGSSLLYYKSGFTATVTLSVGVWALASNTNTTPDQILTPATPLTITYDPNTGIQYNPIAYWLLNTGNTTGFERVKVTVTAITVSGTSNGWTATNVLPLLTIENEMRVLRYFSTPALTAPTVTPVYDATNHPDQLSVSWPFPAGANTSQLEYAWVENETKGTYYTGSTFSTDKLFQLNSTRIDIDTSGKVFNIPLLYDADPAKGGGTLYYRVRSVLRKNDGSVITGAWSVPQTFAYGGHQPSLNWQSSTSFAENGKSKTVIQYFDGSLRGRQTVTKDNSTGNTTVAETIYDMQGRPNVQILPTPALSTAIQYYKDFNRFTGQTTNDDPAKYFDLSVTGTGCSGAPKLDITRGNGQYYSANNPWKTTENTAAYIPDANGYAYTETRYTDDPTQRVSSQGGVGQAHQPGNGHETKYYYGKPSQNELDALFGTEAGDASHYFKNMVLDANGQMSVSYVDMHGRTVATALAGDAPGKLAPLNPNVSFYPDITTVSLVDSLASSATNIIKGDSIEAINTLLVPATTLYTFNYQLTPAILQLMNCNSQQICYDCKYNLDISIRQEGCDNQAPIVKHYDNLQIVPANQACNTPMGFVGDNVSTPQTQISFSIPMAPGSWVVRKTLSINDAMFKQREAIALSNFLCKTQQAISDSVFIALSATTACSTPPATRNCTACQAVLGTSYATSSYKTKYIASVGGTTTLTDAAIHALYTQDSLDCADACGISVNQVFNTLTGIRTQMLNDMMPYTGQYAIPVASVGSMSRLEAKYNIFTTSYTGSYGQFPGTKPFYQNPTDGTTNFYTTSDGSADATIYPNGNAADHSMLNTISTDNFASIFNPNWANQLIYYHPEYSKLNFAQTTLQASYTWLDNVMQCNTYAQALAKGYLTPISSDPYFINNYVPADKTNMQRYLTQYTGNVPSGQTASNNIQLSIWRLANGQALCDTSQPLSIRKACMLNMNVSAIDASATTAAQKDAVWQAFRNSYLGYRNEMIMAFINSQASSLPSAAMAQLQLEGKQLRFANAQTQASQNGWSWWSIATSTNVDSVTLAQTANTYVTANTRNQCVAQRPFWQMRLMQCEQLQQFLLNQIHSDSVKVTTIINVILDSMVMVCNNSIDGKNPSGATNVNPVKLPVVPANFEDIVNHVFTQYGIATLPGNNYFCNPYSVDYPKPYGNNPQLFVNVRSTADTCNCTQFAVLQAAAQAAGFTPGSFSSINAYLLANYGDTLTLPLWQGLQQCSTNSWYHDTCYTRSGGTSSMSSFSKMVTPMATVADSCVHLYFQPIHLSTAVIIPAFLNCGYVKPCVSCAVLQSYTAGFRLLYPDYAGVPYSSGGSSIDTGMAKQNALWARYLNYKTGFSKSANEYIAAFLNCGTGTGVADLVLSDRNAQPPTGTSAPYIYAASNSITFANGYSSLLGDNFMTVIAANAGGSGAALCAFDKPLNYVALPDTTHSNPCQAVKDQANFIAQLLFQKIQDSLIANFDSLYRDKCLSAQKTEVFYATYQPKEYHYTLYYYDQAGNLLKTLAPAAVKPNYSSTYFGQIKTARLAATDLSNGTNIENMATQYRYNTLNQVIIQKTPDAGISRFWYDRLGRLAISQNANQVAAVAYSYTLYDPLGRIIEVGQKPQSTVMTQTISQDTTALKTWIAGGSSAQQITRTLYDVQYGNGLILPPYITQLNLRNRVSATMVIDVDNTNATPYRAATFYSYDIHGNVDTLLQDYGVNSVMFAATGNRFKTITYDYDLISGKVNQVSYQPQKGDGFYHQYSYDAENRLTSVRTSRDSILWQNDATYTYYRHGPLARTQLGDLQVQGIDYAYTLHGWLKSINPSAVTASGDLFDADGTGTTPLFGRDAYRLDLNYYDDGVYTDYTPIAPPTGYIQGNALPTAQKNNLYNGNIGSMAVNIRKLAAQATAGAAYAGPMLYNYKYDQLNRIVSLDAWAANGSFAPTGTTPMNDFAERYTYDPNGNILSLSRNGTTGNGGQLAMDNLSYQYVYAKSTGGTGEYIPGQAPSTGVDHLTNQLSSIRDAVGAANYSTDIDNQSAQNYSYDAIGNLVADVQAGITNITWSVYGKILTITKGGSTITYTYDAAGNRISKTAAGITTWYVRDATGNVMSVYVQGDGTKNSGALTQTEVHLYGSSRLGMLSYNLNVTGANLVQQPQRLFTRGSKFFELSNHLGNVLVTVSDKKLQQTTDNSTVAYYNPDVVSANDYYAGGMLEPGRTYNSQNAVNGFNGKRKDNDIHGEGNAYDFGERIYDPRVVTWYSIDPMTRKFPYLSPYVYALDNPVNVLDPDGGVVIFINGQNPGWQGGTSGYWNGVDKKIMNQIGDHNAIYRDGSSGGFFNTLFSNDIRYTNLNPRIRILNGYNQGKLDAAEIIAKLRRDPHDPNKITETVKIVTHSMGTAYSRGYTAAMQEYVDNYNKNNPNSKLTGFKMEIQVDIAAFQGSDLPADKNVKTSVHMNGDKDDVANGKGTGTAGKLLRFLSPSSDVPDSKTLKTLPGTTHSVKDYANDYDINQIPKAADFFKLITPNSIYPKAQSDATHVVPTPGPIH